MGIDGKVFNCRIQIFENFCHQRSQEVNKGQMEVKIKNEKKSTIWVLMERSSIVEINYLTFFVIRGHWRSMEVNKGQMEVKIKN